MLLRQWVARAFLTLLIATTALVSVGLTASPDAAFAISVQPALFRLDPAGLEQCRATARVLALDVDIKLGSMHLHLGWPGVPI